eukprot:455165-Pyramimonas_sp.AAC.1
MKELEIALQPPRGEHFTTTRQTEHNQDVPFSDVPRQGSYRGWNPIRKGVVVGRLQQVLLRLHIRVILPLFVFRSGSRPCGDGPFVPWDAAAVPDIALPLLTHIQIWTVRH